MSHLMTSTRPCATRMLSSCSQHIPHRYMHTPCLMLCTLYIYIQHTLILIVAFNDYVMVMFVIRLWLIACVCMPGHLACSAYTTDTGMIVKHTDLPIIQALRGSLLKKYAKIRTEIDRLHNSRMSPYEKTESLEAIRSHIMAAWRTDEIRRTKPSPQVRHLHLVLLQPYCWSDACLTLAFDGPLIGTHSLGVLCAKQDTLASLACLGQQWHGMTR